MSYKEPLKKTFVFVAGARPNFMKVAPLLRAVKKYPFIIPILVHTGQHYDDALSDIFFRELEIPPPDYNLGVGPCGPGQQTSIIMTRFAALLEETKTDLVIVVGDVNSTIACALASRYHKIPVAHVEAGLRSFDADMPEEINRITTDHLSDFLFCTEPSAVKNLRAEGIASSKIHFVGNVMIDTLLGQKKRADTSLILKTLSLTPKNYCVATLHRASNVDSKSHLSNLIKLLQQVAKKIPVVFPVHPRTQKRMKTWGIFADCIKITKPLGYLDFIKLLSESLCVVTDSGGIQEETTILGIPCFTLRDSTERPVTVTNGTNTILGSSPKNLLSKIQKTRKHSTARRPRLWDGKAAERIVNILISHRP